MFAAERTFIGPHGPLVYREQGEGPPMVLLHGIGSGAPSWQALADTMASDFRVLAWDAPGYGNSACLERAAPLGSDYAAALEAWLVALNVTSPIVVGHSLGALIACAWAAKAGARVRALVLASPARGYGRCSPQEREAKQRERVETMERMGPQGLAAERAPRLCTPRANAAVIEQVRSVMARVSPRGYAQAASMLAHDDLFAYLRAITCPLAVLCGTFDTVTPVASCAEVAEAAGTHLTELPGVAHACYVEDPQGFASALRGVIRETLNDNHD